MRGNVLDMAVGVIIGAAFGKIVSSLVDDILMPPIGWLVGVSISATARLHCQPIRCTLQVWLLLIMGHSFRPLSILSLWLLCVPLVKGVNRLSRMKEEKPKMPSEGEKLLTEIRDLLKNK